VRTRRSCRLSCCRCSDRSVMVVAHSSSRSSLQVALNKYRRYRGRQHDAHLSFAFMDSFTSFLSNSDLLLPSKMRKFSSSIRLRVVSCKVAFDRVTITLGRKHESGNPYIFRQLLC
jgi:hypothetical protein